MDSLLLKRHYISKPVGYILLMNGVSLGEAEELVNQAHDICPYSKATKGNIEVKLITELF
jgi:hypothetical protein